MEKKLGWEPAFPINEEETDRIDNGIKIYSGMSKRLLIAKDMMPIAEAQLGGVSADWVRGYLGADKYTGATDYKIALVKYALELADELLKQEAE